MNQKSQAESDCSTETMGKSWLEKAMRSICPEGKLGPYVPEQCSYLRAVEGVKIVSLFFRGDFRCGSGDCNKK